VDLRLTYRTSDSCPCSCLPSLLIKETRWSCVNYSTPLIDVTHSSIINLVLVGLNLLRLSYATIYIFQTRTSLEVWRFSIFFISSRS